MGGCQSNPVIDQPKVLNAPIDVTSSTEAAEEESRFGAFFLEKDVSTMIREASSVSASATKNAPTTTTASASSTNTHGKKDHDVNDYEHKHVLVTTISDDDDNITTVYSEDTPIPFVNRDPINPITFNRCNSSALDKNKVCTPPDSIKLPNNAYVMLPNVPQRGYEPSGIVSYNGTKWVRTKPYEVGTLVWVRHFAPGNKFKWYIPGTINGYVLDDNKVKGYDIHVECNDHELDMSEPGITNVLKCATPQETMLRWNKQMPPCPVDSIVSSTDAKDYYESVEHRVEKAVEQYGPGLGFQGAKQNGLG